jgi:membrane protease subunit HflC
VVTRFGNRSRSTEPGLRFDPWWPFESITRIDSRLLVLDVEEAEYLTKDKKNVVASGYALWRVEDPLKYLQRVFSRSGAESRISDILSSQIGAALGGVPFSALVSTEATEIRLDAVVQSIFEKSREIVRRDYGVRPRSSGSSGLAFPSRTRSRSSSG